jgi:phosphate acyltransferase
VAAMIALAIDAMSGDFGAASCVAGALRALQQDPELHLLLVGRSAGIESALASLTPARALRERYQIVEAPEVITMDDNPPSQALLDARGD